MELLNIITTAVATLGFFACLFNVSLDVVTEATMFWNKKRTAKLFGYKFNTKRNVWKAAHKLFLRLVFSVTILAAFVVLSIWVGNICDNLNESSVSVLATLGASVVVGICTIVVIGICLVKNRRYDKVYSRKMSIAKEA